MKVTMQDVADRAGVDKATVSRVLRGDHRISEKTKSKSYGERAGARLPA